MSRGADSSIRVWGVSLLLVWAVGCASTPETGAPRPPPDSVLHVVAPGENLYRLSQYYGVTVDSIREANQIADVTALQIGQELWIPGSLKSASSNSLAQPFASGARVPSVPRAGGTGPDLVWPVRGKLSSRFGWRDGRLHEGIDIPAKRGTPVRAAAAGRVIHSGRGLGDYGKVVIVKHEGRYSTVYAHNDRLKVKKGQFIEKGDVVGTVGNSGNASGPHCHFELRRDRKPIDPLLYLE